METETKENQSQSLEIAKTIIEQIKYADGSALMAWGASNFTALPESKEYQGALKFHCNGLFFVGYVIVSLRWVDDYTISFVDKKGVEKHKMENIFCDSLVPAIDWVEGK